MIDRDLASGLDLVVRSAGDLAWVELHGEVDIGSRDRLAEAMHDAESTRPSLVVVDLHGLELIDSTGLAVLLAAQRRAAGAGRRLVLLLGTGLVPRTLHITGLDTAFELVDDQSSLPEAPL